MFLDLSIPAYTWGNVEFCVLGLLMMFPHSLYDFKLAFSRGLSLFYSSSLGSIQVAVKKLLTLGLIEIHERSTQGRAKIMYRITDAGRAFFVAQFTAPIPSGRLEETILARYHFLGLIERQERVEVLFFLTRAIETGLTELQTLKSGYDRQTIPEAWQEIAYYQLGTADYGISAHQTGLAWFKNQLMQEQQRLEEQNKL